MVKSQMQSISIIFFTALISVFFVASASQHPIPILDGRGGLGLVGLEGNNLDGDDFSDFKEFPHFVRIFSYFSINQTYVQFGGTLISSRTIVSAAHCFVNEPNGTMQQFVVILGCNAPFSVDMLKEDYRDPLCHIHLNFTTRSHSQFNASTGENDIAIISLDEPEPLFNDVPTNVDLDLRNKRSDTMMSAVGANCYALGWGCVDPDDPDSCGVHKVALTLIELEHCITTYSGGNITWSQGTQICALSQSAMGWRLCGGDSGGPLFCSGQGQGNIEGKFEFVGVLSFGDNNTVCDPSVPKVFSRVGAYLNWITGNTRDGLSGWAIFGIVVASVVGCMLLALGITVLMRK